MELFRQIFVLSPAILLVREGLSPDDVTRPSDIDPADPQKRSSPRVSLTILPIDMKVIFDKMARPIRRGRPGGSCQRTIARRLPNLFAPKELPAARLPALCRPKVWLLLPTGLRWKSTRLRVIANAEHKSLLARERFGTSSPIGSIAGLVTKLHP